jgi:exosortase A
MERSSTLRLSTFTLLIVIWLGLSFETFTSLYNTWITSNTYGHGLLIIPIVIWLIVRNKNELSAVETKPSNIGVVSIFLISCLWFISSLTHINVLEQFFYLMLPVALVWAYYGFNMLKTLAFPLIFMFLAIPVGDFLIPYLQFSTADIAVYLLQLVGVPVYRDAMYIQIPNGNFFVAEACSGIRFLISTVTIGILFAHLNFQSKYKQLLFILFSIVVSVLGNGARAFLMILIGHISNMKAAVGFDHIVYGWVFFSIILAILLIIGNKFSDIKIPEKINTSIKSAEYYNLPNLKFVIIIVFSIISGPILQKIYIYQSQNQSILVNQAHTNVDLESLAWKPLFPLADVERYKKIKIDNNHVIDMFFVGYNNEDRNKELISYQNQFFDPDKWSLKTIQSGYVLLNNKTKVPYQKYIISNLKGETRELRVIYKVGNNLLANKLLVKLHQLTNKIQFKEFGGEVIILSTEVDSHSTQTLDEFMINQLSTIISTYIK